MSGGALGLALGAAFLHALWNVLLAGSRDSVAATGALLLFGDHLSRNDYLGVDISSAGEVARSRFAR